MHGVTWDTLGGCKGLQNLLGNYWRNGKEVEKANPV